MEKTCKKCDKRPAGSNKRAGVLNACVKPVFARYAVKILRHHLSHSARKTKLT